VSATLLATVVVVALLASLLPAASLAAEGGRKDYIVTLDVTGSGRVIVPSNRQARVRIAARAERAAQVTERLGTQFGIQPRHRFGSAMAGFSARMTSAQARALAQDPKVASVREVRRASFASQVAQPGVQRVKAIIPGGPAADVAVDVAVLDTGIGPSAEDQYGDRSGEPLPMEDQEPQGKPELNIRGGVNCWDDPATRAVEAWEKGKPEVWDDWWGDTHGHGTHVAGIIGARDNVVGTVGVAPGVRLWSVRVFGGRFGTEADVVCGLEWVIDRNSDGDAGNDIEVINMSLEVPRYDLEEDCDIVLNDPSGDPIQQKVCEVVALGVVVVGAAGNGRENANLWAPGGFDNVISVGAMTDTDGEGWADGSNAACTGYTSQRDDTYAAAYSNYGRDIDIVAPGTCVRSTWPTRSGAATQMLTGTSMAAPHVTGAVARYLEANPGTTPRRMQRLLRATGRLDWDAKSDPLWSGTADVDPPNRVLDVAALTGSHGLKTWVYHGSFKVAGEDRKRTTRVDVQRSGGYPGTVTLSQSGLPAGASGSFVNRTLDGLDASKLGTNLEFGFALDGEQGYFDVGIRSTGPDVDAHTRNLKLTVDRAGPTVSGLGPKIRKVMLARNGAASTKLLWQASDRYSSVAAATLQRRIGTSKTWKNVANGNLRSATATLKRGQSNRFRVKATDSLANNRWSSSIGAKLGIRDSAAGQWRKPAGWSTKKVGKAYGGSILVAKGATASLSSDFYGTAVAVAASVGPARGSVRLRVDGGPWRTVSLKQSKALHRKVVWSERLPKGAHTIDIQGLSGQSTIDALLFIR
jgi:subtilisin family serine protease